MTREIRILVAEPEDFSMAAVQLLQRAGKVTLQTVSTELELSDALNRFDVVIVRLGFRINSELIPPAPRCRILAVPTTGLDHIDLDECTKNGIEVISLRGEREFLKTVRATAEHTLALALALVRKLPQAVQSVRQGEWDRDKFRGSELFGRTAGIVGLGRLGTIAATYFDTFGMRVLGYDVCGAVEPSPAVEVDTLEKLLGQSDLISVHVDYSHGTRHLIDAGEFARMRPGALLINTSRGGVVNEVALLEALRSGHLGGAALDVLEGEPDVDAEYPAIRYAKTHSNLVITPHIGGNTLESLEKTEIFIARKILERLHLDLREEDES